MNRFRRDLSKDSWQERMAMENDLKLSDDPHFVEVIKLMTKNKGHHCDAITVCEERVQIPLSESTDK
jgi:hypothetical protein